MSGKNGKEGNGKEGKGKKGENGKQKGAGAPGGYGGDENMSGELFKIYQQQQALKQQLKDALSNQGSHGNKGDLLKQVESIEEELLDKGFTNEIIEKMVNLKHELLKLENARLKQGQDSKREANTNKKQYSNSNNSVLPMTKDYFNEVEILDRQALPLQTIYKKKVNRYFKDKDAKL
jgi:septum formation inhibitor MinC